MGDPCGISPELTVKLLAQADVAESGAAVVVIGDRRVLAAGEAVAKTGLPVASIPDGGKPAPKPGTVALLDLHHLDPNDITMSEASAAGGGFALANLRKGLELARDGAIDALMFTPLNKHALRLAGNPYTDEIQFAANVLGYDGPHGEFNVLDKLWNARVTSHVPFKDVSSHITIDSVLEALELTDTAMKVAGYARPRIAVAALNPHAGDGGNFGREEIDVIGPGRGARPEAPDRGGRAVPVRHRVPARPRRSFRCGADHVSRPGPDRDQAAGIRARRDGSRRPAGADLHARARHGLRHRRQRHRECVRDRAGLQTCLRHGQGPRRRLELPRDLNFLAAIFVGPL